MVKAHRNGYWIGAGGHMFDRVLAAGIVDVLTKISAESVIDIGCGDGSYSDYLKRNGFRCSGYDGNPDTIVITHGTYQIADFSQPQDFGIFDCVLSLEVGEHIPEEYAGVFLDNLAHHAEKAIIMSWAIPGQTGFGHVNEQPNSEIIDRMLFRGLLLDQQLTNYLRLRISSCPWFKDTVMVFRYD